MTVGPNIANLIKSWDGKSELYGEVAPSHIDIDKSVTVTESTFDERKKAAEEKYKLTPEDIEHNKMVELGKKWGTNTTGTLITPASKAKDAGDEQAERLLSDDVSGLLRLVRLTMPTLYGGKDLFSESYLKTAERKEIVEAFKRYKKEYPDKKLQFKEDTLVLLLDRFPDIFDELDFDIGEEQSVLTTEGGVGNEIFTEFAMEVPKDTIQYIRPVYSNSKVDQDPPEYQVTFNTDDVKDAADSMAAACGVPASFLGIDKSKGNDSGSVAYGAFLPYVKTTQTLRPPKKTEQKPEKLSWKKQQRQKKFHK